MNAPFGTLVDPNPVLFNTKAGPIFQDDIGTAIDVAMFVLIYRLIRSGYKLKA